MHPSPQRIPEVIVNRIRRIAAALAITGVALSAPMVLAPAAQARSCKWVLVSYDPATGTSTYICSTARA